MSKSICTILARGGSKGVKNKNIRDLYGKPLIHHTIEQAIASAKFDAVVISSDSDEILDICSSIKEVTLVSRPEKFANDTISKRPAIKHAVESVEKLWGEECTTVVDLDCTSPLRTTNDIDEALSIFYEGGHDNLLTAMPARRSPYFNMLQKNLSGKISLVIPTDPPVTCRQDAPPCYDMNASIYIWKRDILFLQESNYLETTGLYVMPEERSIDIDTEADFKYVEYLMRDYHVK